MKKIILLITILFVSVISTACINNLAVQELNNKAQEYMAKGETDKAISRLRSSIDLDTSIFETHYNLGIALIQAEEYEEAQSALKNAISLKPDFADAYYSLAVAYDGLADKLVKEEKNDDDTDVKVLQESDKLKVVELYNLAIENYNTYLVKKTDASDKDKVEQQIDYLNKQIQAYQVDRDMTVSKLFNDSNIEVVEE